VNTELENKVTERTVQLNQKNHDWRRAMPNWKGQAREINEIKLHPWTSITGNSRTNQGSPEHQIMERHGVQLEFKTLYPDTFPVTAFWRA